MRKTLLFLTCGAVLMLGVTGCNREAADTEADVATQNPLPAPHARFPSARRWAALRAAWIERRAVHKGHCIPRALVKPCVSRSMCRPKAGDPPPDKNSALGGLCVK